MKSESTPLSASPGQTAVIRDAFVEHHPVMAQFVNLLRGIYESKDVAAMTVAVQVAAQVLQSPAFQQPYFTLGDQPPTNVGAYGFAWEKES